MAKTYTVRNVSDEDLRRLRRAAFIEDDIVQVAICNIALGDVAEGLDWSAHFDHPTRGLLRAMTRGEALQECVDALNYRGQGDGRCEACGWPLATSRDDGCVYGDCSFRPHSRHPRTGTGD